MAAISLSAPYKLGFARVARNRVGSPAITVSWTLEREKELCEKAGRGDQDAQRDLFKHFSQPLYAAVIAPRVPNSADAEDILRDTLLRALTHLHRYRWNDAGLWPWLRRIAINLIYDRTRRRQTQAKMEESLRGELTTAPDAFAAGAESSLIEREEREREKAQLRKALDALNPRYRQAIELRILAERSRDECASELDVSVSTFDVVLHRALSALRKSWRDI